MGKTDRNYWLKLKDDFFNQREIKKLRLVAGGDTFTIIYLKMQLLAIKDEGFLKFYGTEESIAEQLALEFNENIEDVKLTLSFLYNNKLIEKVDDYSYLITKVPRLIGSETTAAERMRKSRIKKNANIVKKDNKRNNVTVERNKNEQIYGALKHCYTDIDIDIDTDIDIDIENSLVEQEQKEEQEKKKRASKVLCKHNESFEKIILFFNQQLNTNYKATTKLTRKLIRARLDEGYSFEDFKAVIKTKKEQWEFDAYMKNFLKPQTLFSEKFGIYLDESKNNLSSEEEMEALFGTKVNSAG